MNNDRKYKCLTLNNIKQDLSRILKQIEFIIKAIHKLKAIDSYKSSACEDCDKNCGRTNAEILKCLMKKSNHIKHDQNRYDAQNYTKEILESDLKNMETTIQICYSKLNEVIETYEE
jgi:hypothetical protein